MQSGGGEAANGSSVESPSKPDVFKQDMLRTLPSSLSIAVQVNGLACPMRGIKTDQLYMHKTSLAWLTRIY